MPSHGGYAFADQVSSLVSSLNTGAVKIMAGQAITSTGFGRVFLTDDGTITGNPLFSSIIAATASVRDSPSVHVYTAISADRRYVDVYVLQHGGVTVLGIGVLSGTATAVNGATIDVIALGT